MKNLLQNQSYLKRVILGISIIIVLIIIMMISISLFQQEQEWQEEEKILNQGNRIPTTFEKEVVTDHSTFYSVGNAVQRYLNTVSLDLEKIDSTPVPGSKMPSATALYAQDQGITDENSKKEVVYDLLNPDYIEQENITKENVLSKIENNPSVTFTPLEMYQLLGSNRTAYVVYGKMKNNHTEEQMERIFIVNVDKTNNTFHITPVNQNQYEEISEIPLNAENQSIAKNNHNFFSYRIMQENEIAQKYFTYYKSLMQTQPEEAYYLLEEEYRNKRFGSIEEFKRYVNNHKEEIEGYIAKKYEVNELVDGTEYICQDQYQHTYTFKVSAVMKFHVKLDTYTVESDEIKQKYQMATERRKVEMNVDKWILMLNYRDYKAAYEVLDEDFRAQYFPTVEDFERYMKKIFPYYYGVNLSDFSKEAGVYIQKIILTDITAKNKMTVPETIIMKLTEDGFVMSFRILG